MDTYPVKYPEVIGEFDTVKELLDGTSIARFGDGELKIVWGAGYAREKPNKRLTDELRHIIWNTNKYCAVGIPTMDIQGPKYDNWLRHKRRFSRVIDHDSDLSYYSAFISRPDSAPWINTIEYARLVESLWAGKRTTVIAEPENSLVKLIMMTAKDFKLIECPHEGAYAEIDAFEREARKGDPEVIVMSVGPTATALAHRLSERGLHAIDLGSAGGFLRKLLYPSNKGPKRT